MPRKRLTVKNYTAEEIHNLLRKDEKYMIGVRLYAVYQISKGAVSRDLEQIYNVSFKSVCNWVNSFNENGLEGLKDKPRVGRPPQLTTEQKLEIKRVVIEESPEKYGYNTATWTGPILINLISKKYGINYKKAQIYNILKKMELTHQKGKGIYPEADEYKREEFIETIKKTSE